ncbi:histidine kinase [Larkinella arboricola]|uniref:Histidine kinase n=1 Tax=Larkinella arboricola TaxID=643671 RepID=A0A327X5X8_LARAB|nr:histidine kinase [Larkinella arboricola]RAK02490.1 histidine kinase [Larkinella arboricola]
MNIIRQISQRSPVGILLSVLVCIMGVYGGSAIIYFTTELLLGGSDAHAPTLFIVVNNLFDALVAVLTSQVFLRFGDRIPSVWLRHVLLTVAIIVAGMIESFFLFWLVGDPSVNHMEIPKWVNIFYIVPAPLIGNLFYYFQRQARNVTRKITEQEYQLLHLEQLKARAELEALQAKINPHFLYNALNSIASLVHDEPDRAERMVLLLSKLFRYTTGMKNRYFNSVADELEMVRTYLDVEQVRFGDRLSYRIDLPDSALNEVYIPQFLLQPLVENAIKHGISKVAGPGAIILRITEENGWLTCRIHDNGPAFPEELVAGYGLQSIQDKLILLYGNDARLLVENKPMKEVIVQIKKERLSASPDVMRPVRTKPVPQ